MVIYADILLTVNWWIDLLLLCGTRRACGIRARPWRLVLGALVGAASAFILLLPPLPVPVTLAVKVVTAAAMVAVAFPWQGLRAMLRPLAWLTALTVGSAGLCAALYFYVAPPGFYVKNGVPYHMISPLLLIGLTTVCYGLSCVMTHMLRRRAPMGTRHTVELRHGDRTLSVLCLFDSGDHLTEPFSGAPVIAVERRALARLLDVPPDIAALPPGWRVIPYAAMGGSGLLPAFLPDGISVHTPQGELPLTGCYVAACPPLGRGEYQGLLGSAAGDRLRAAGEQMTVRGRKTE